MKSFLTASLSLFVAIVLSLSSCGSAFAESSQKLDTISQRCGTIRTTLISVQKIDTNTRSHLGNTYEELFSDYITPLNARLVKNNQTDSELLELQSDFSSERAKFNQNFIEYNKHLEALLNINCATNPSEFYEQLTVARKYRALLRTNTENLSRIINDFSSAVKRLKASL